MNTLKIKRRDSGLSLETETETVFLIKKQEGCLDELIEMEIGVWKWKRSAEKPVRKMKMDLQVNYKADYWLVPAVNYNGNGWGNSVEYTSFEDNGIPWTYAWHRCAIPACTYSENDKWAVSLMGDLKGGMSCSISIDDENTYQSLCWPEQEGPRVLTKRYWNPPFMGEMEPCQHFSAIIMVFEVDKPRGQVKNLLSKSWRLFSPRKEIKMGMKTSQLWHLDKTFAKILWSKEPDGLTGFVKGMSWDERTCNFIKRTHNKYEIGWVGQNASLAVSLLYDYIKTGDEDSKNKGLSVLDSWAKYARLDNGLIYTHLDFVPTNLESVPNGDINVSNLDVCNLGTAALHYLEATKIMDQIGVQRPEYFELAIGLCDFAVKAQNADGSFAKSWRRDGSVSQKEGTIGCFFIQPLILAYGMTGEKRYLDSAIQAFSFYFQDIAQYGYTTAGALDSYCIDKESSGPLLRSALALYNVTHDATYLENAEAVATYLSTWQWHYSTQFPEDSVLAQLKYDTFGGTSVSTAHNAMDPWALYYVEALMELASLTGNAEWKERAKAIWYNGTQLISDGTLCILGKVRPAGSQDESYRNTRWGRPDNKIFIPSQWLPAWMSAFRMETLRHMDDGSILNDF